MQNFRESGEIHSGLLDRSLHILNDLSRSLLSISPEDFLKHVAEKAAELLLVPVCIVWKLDKPQNKLRIVATYGDVDESYRELELELSDPGIRKHLSSRKAGYLSDVRIPHPEYYKHHHQASKRGWVSLLSAPMWEETELFGMLDVYTVKQRHFDDWEEQIFNAFANQAALSIQNADLLRANRALEKYRKLRDRDRLITSVRDAVRNFTSQDNSPGEGQLDEVLNLIVRECAEATNAKVCALRLWDKAKASDYLELNAFYAVPEIEQDGLRKEKFKAGENLFAEHVSKIEEHSILIDTYNDTSWLELFDGTGLLSILCVPIKSGGTIIGTISVSSDQIGFFGQDQKEIIEGILDSVSIAIGRAILTDNLLSLAQASSESDSLDELLSELVKFTRDLMREPISLVWLLDKEKDGFTLGAFTGPEGQGVDLKNVVISNRTTQQFLKRKSPLYFADAGKVENHPYARQVTELEWLSMLAMPLAVKDRVIGILEVYSYKHERKFNDAYRQLFASWAAQASIAIVNLRARKRLQALGRIMRKMVEANDVSKLLNLVLDSALETVRSERGWISILDPVTGKLEIIIHRKNPPNISELKVGQGITGKALQDEQPILAEDVKEKRWEKIYVEYWPDTRSELAVPILISQAEARIGKEVERRPKLIGVLNVESPTVKAFSKADKENLWALARLTAIMIERLELDRKLSVLTDIETEIVGNHSYDETIKILMRGITETLGYDYVNISLVVPELNSIRTEYTIGIPEEQKTEFKRLASHALDSKDIQADIVRTKRIEVPAKDDQRFDRVIFEKFGHRDFVRVFLPMIVPSDGRVIGTVEAGYTTPGYRKHIYEQDVQILQGFINYAVQALENREKGLLETICHEFRAPIVGINSNASFLQRRFKQLDDEKINHKLTDISTDCYVLLQQVEELEHILGGPSPESSPELTLVMRDIVIKTINQLKPLMANVGLYTSDIELKGEDISKIKLYIDRPKLSQVVFNLLMNSIKYAEDNSRLFKIRIDVDQIPNHYIIRFRDWGIGIKKGLEEKIFEKGFRTPEAINKNVTGSGLGLTLARKIMRGFGGDLRLINNFKPTEFHLVLPKGLREMPK